jgi:magnesium transporter
MIRALFFSLDSNIRTDVLPGEFAQLILPTADTENPAGLLWVDFEDTPPEDDEQILRGTFNFHPLAVDDALQETHIPKIDDWGEYLYIVLHAVVFDNKDGGNVDTLELDVFVGKNYLVTHHDQSINAIERVWSSVQRDPRHLRNGADHLLYKLIDEVVASYMPVVEVIDDEIDRTEDQIFDKPTPRTLEHIFFLKRAVLHLRRIIGPQREVLNKLARDDYDTIDERERVYFRDIYDHLVRLYDITESMRDMISGSLDIYLSVINNRMNDIMKTLTIITTFFMPIAFVTGFFGMNFFQPVAGLDIWTERLAFIITVFVIVGTPTGMYLWMRKRGWM